MFFWGIVRVLEIWRRKRKMRKRRKSWCRSWRWRMVVKEVRRIGQLRMKLRRFANLRRVEATGERRIIEVKPSEFLMGMMMMMMYGVRDALAGWRNHGFLTVCILSVLHASMSFSLEVCQISSTVPSAELSRAHCTIYHILFKKWGFSFERWMSRFNFYTGFEGNK